MYDKRVATAGVSSTWHVRCLDWPSQSYLQGCAKIWTVSVYVWFTVDYSPVTV